MVSSRLTDASHAIDKRTYLLTGFIRLLQLVYSMLEQEALADEGAREAMRAKSEEDALLSASAASALPKRLERSIDGVHGAVVTSVKLAGDSIVTGTGAAACPAPACSPYAPATARGPGRLRHRLRWRLCVIYAEAYPGERDNPQSWAI